MTEPTPPTGPAGNHGATDSQEQPTWCCRQRTDLAAASLALLRRQLRDAVDADELDADSVNDMLVAADVPPLLRRWTVNFYGTLTLSVIAESSDTAFDTARNLLDAALGKADVGYHETDVGDATPSEVVDDR